MGKAHLLLPGIGLVDAVITTLDSPTRRLVSWYAPALGCVEGQRIATFPQTDGTVSVDARYPVFVSQGDPDEDLFADDGAQEVTPLVAMRRNITAAAGESAGSEAGLAEIEGKASEGPGIKNKQNRI